MKWIILIVLLVLLISIGITLSRRSRAAVRSGKEPEGYSENIRHADRPDDADPGSPTRGPV